MEQLLLLSVPHAAFGQSGLKPAWSHQPLNFEEVGSPLTLIGSDGMFSRWICRKKTASSLDGVVLLFKSIGLIAYMVLMLFVGFFYTF